MNAYVFLQTEPGKAAAVMREFVKSGLAARAVAVTGEFEVIGRIENVTWKRLTEIAMKEVPKLKDVTSVYTAPVIPTEIVTGATHPPIFPFQTQVSALVSLTLNTSLPETFNRLDRIEGVTGLVFLAAGWDMIAQVAGKTYEEVVTIIVRDIRPLPDILHLSTAFILDATPASKIPPKAGKSKPRTSK